MTNEILKATSHENYDRIKAQMERLALKKDRLVIAALLIF